MAYAKNCSKGDDHCCWLLGNPCHYVVNNKCSLLVREGSWEEVYKTEEYVNDVKPKLEFIRKGMNCNDFPFVGEKCATCGSIGE